MDSGRKNRRHITGTEAFLILAGACGAAMVIDQLREKEPETVEISVNVPADADACALYEAFGKAANAHITAKGRGATIEVTCMNDRREMWQHVPNPMVHYEPTGR